jgi:hypothetical protein
MRFFAPKQNHLMGGIIMRAIMIAAALTWAITGSVSADEKSSGGKSPEWSMKATIIEACSCPMFCQCYFNTKPAAHGGHGDHGGEHFCKFNNAFRVDRGRYGKTKLDGAKFWVTGDLGGDFTMGCEWSIVTFDAGVTPEQREAIKVILGHVYPVTWKSFSIAEDAEMEWKATKDRAEARLDGGKTAEVILNRYPGMTDEPIVIKNLKYFGVPRNSGFIMMPNEVEAYRIGDKAFEFKGSNGFMITIDIASRDVEKK